MNISSINKSATIYKSNDNKEKKSLQSSDSSINSSKHIDTVEISSEARRLGSIQNKIEQGYYDQPEVIKQVALKLDADL